MVKRRALPLITTVIGGGSVYGNRLNRYCMQDREVPVNSIKLVTLLCLVIGAVVGCTTNFKPTARSIQRDTAPSGASIIEFLDLIRIDDLVYLFVEEEKGVLEAKLSEPNRI